MPYVKLDCQTLDSSLWACDPDRIIFITALMMAHPFALDNPAQQLYASTIAPTGWTVPPGSYGFVKTSGRGILRRALVDDASGMAALERLSAPDPDSRTTEHGGRRLARISGGWIVLNYAKYREKDMTAAERMRRYRERLEAGGEAAAGEAGEGEPRKAPKRRRADKDDVPDATAPAFSANGHTEHVAYLRDVLSALAPKMTVTDERILKWITTYGDDPFRIASALVEKRTYIARVKSPDYAEKIMKEHHERGWPDHPGGEVGRGYVAHALRM